MVSLLTAPLIPPAPRFDEIVGALLSTVARWLFGSGVLSGIVITLILTVLAVRSWLELVRDSRAGATWLASRLGTGATRTTVIARLVREQLAGLPAVRIVLGVAVTVLVLALQGLWLFASWGASSWLTDLWNAYIWGAWELPAGEPWRSVTGYYTVWCAVVLAGAWAAAAWAGRDVSARRDRLEAAGLLAALLPAVAPIPLALILVLGTALGILWTAVALVVDRSSIGAYWADLGGLWLYVAGLAGFVAGTFLVILATDLACRAWSGAERRG